MTANHCDDCGAVGHFNYCADCLGDLCDTCMKVGHCGDNANGKHEAHGKGFAKSPVTRAVSVVMERAPGGGLGWSLRVGGADRFLFGSAFVALAWIRQHLERLGAEQEERARVLNLLIRELDRKRCAECVAEVPHA